MQADEEARLARMMKSAGIGEGAGAVNGTQQGKAINPLS